jgi:hypothetical protein
VHRCGRGDGSVRVGAGELALVAGESTVAAAGLCVLVGRLAAVRRESTVAAELAPRAADPAVRAGEPAAAVRASGTWWSCCPQDGTLQRQAVQWA